MAALLGAAVVAFDRDGSMTLLLLAALLHELGHLLCIRLSGGRVEDVRLTVSGADIRYGGGADLLIAAGGPLASLLAAVTAVRLGAMRFTGLNLALCLFNLLPVYPLDGGRLLALTLERLLGPDRGERMTKAVSLTSALLLAAAVTIASLRTGALWTLWLASFLLWKQREL